MPITVQMLTIKGTRYALIPEREYRRLASSKAAPAESEEEDLVDAEPFMLEVLGRNLKAARLAAKPRPLTQAELAEKLGITQSFVSAAERGVKEIGSPYVARVMKACKR